MDEKIDQAIEKMADQAKASHDAQKALHYSQAALNLAHVKGTLAAIHLEGKPKKQGAGV